MAVSRKTFKNRDWRSFNKCLLPPKKGLLGFGGEIFVGGKDGKLMMTQDQFGRKPKTKKEWEEKERQVNYMQEHLQKLLKKHREEAKEQ